MPTTRAIGLDIGTFAVRAAEVVVTNSGVRVVRFGQLTLPHGAVVAGEVIDIDSVALTLRRLWERVGFRSRTVVLGLANQRVLVRQTVLPAMNDEDMAAALQFQDTDVLPVSAEEARVDFQRLEEFVDDTGTPRVRLLLASAERSMLTTHLQTAELAGLRVARVDPMPLALVRSIGRSGVTVLEDGLASEALVCVGAGVTTIVVHEAGVPRFARFLSEGAAAATEAVAVELGVDLDTAEDLKRRAGEAGADEVGVAVSRVVVRLVDDIDSSIRFHRSQDPDVPVGRIVLTGAGSRLAGLPARLAGTTGLPVEAARPSQLFEIDAGLTDDELLRAEPNLATVIGLALASVPVSSGERRINLLPTSIEEVREVRARALVAGLVLAGLLVLLIVIWAFAAHRVSGQQAQEREAAAQAASLQSQIASLGNNGSVTSQISHYDQEITSALTGDVDWAGLLTQIANVMPDNVWLTSFTGTTASGAAAGAPATIGTVSFSAMGLDQTATAQWLSDVAELDSLAAPWVTTSSRSTPTGVVTFSSQANLASGALSDRVARFTGQSP